MHSGVCVCVCVCLFVSLCVCVSKMSLTRSCFSSKKPNPHTHVLRSAWVAPVTSKGWTVGRCICPLP